jgi:hypothetical protein
MNIILQQRTRKGNNEMSFKEMWGGLGLRKVSMAESGKY